MRRTCNEIIKKSIWSWDLKSWASQLYRYHNKENNSKREPNEQLHKTVRQQTARGLGSRTKSETECKLQKETNMNHMGKYSQYISV